MQTYLYWKNRPVRCRPTAGPARYAHVALCAVRLGGMSAAAGGVSRQGRLGAAQLQWMRQRRGGSGAGSPGMAAAASPDLPPAKRRRVSFSDEPETREYTPAPSPPPSPPAHVVGGGGRRVRGGRRGTEIDGAAGARACGGRGLASPSMRAVSSGMLDIKVDVCKTDELDGRVDGVRAREQQRGRSADACMVVKHS